MSASLMSLPQEMLDHLKGYLPPKDFYTTVSRVNKVNREPVE